ncbi:DUF1146 family protein [Oceanobacillus saliphilus]|uniref:DUF1146 family protein n=1 Tax=Oceanobacillus saliphilus TaxID=2925834 RepID=UPI00201DDA72|nr:DUF1146 family protein [Oceanobacillus saliphilus]
MFSIGQMALISMISHLIFIYITWRLVLSMNYEGIIKKGRTTEGRIFLLFITIVIGTGVSRFFLEILRWSSDLVFFF